ncbi:hypothetical protein AB1N83_005562, partial [Pleurotus pulmonarius]
MMQSPGIIFLSYTLAMIHSLEGMIARLSLPIFLAGFWLALGPESLELAQAATTPAPRSSKRIDCEE